MTANQSTASKNPNAASADATLYHVSEEPAIVEFVPRFPPNASSGVDYPVVWAVDESRLQNYLLPRDCPRVTFFPKPSSSSADIERLIGPCGSGSVVAIEAAWYARARDCNLYIYTLARDRFELLDEEAGYWVNRQSVKPSGIYKVSDCLTAVIERGAELRIVNNLWPLRDAVVNSTMGFSCIRMRNAQPRLSSTSV